MGAVLSAVRKTTNKTGNAMEDFGSAVPEIKQTLKNADKALNTADAFMSSLDGIPGRLTTTAEGVGDVAKVGIGIVAFKCLSDFGVSWYRAIKLTRTANDARNDFKKFVDNTTKTEDEIVNVLRNTRGDLKSSAGQFTEDVHKMGQDFGHMAKSLSESSKVSSESAAYASQGFNQASRYFAVACFAFTTSTLAAAMIYLQNSSCYDDQESLLCIAPLKSMAAGTVATGFVAMRMLMPNRVQQQINDDFLIPEEGIDQRDIEWTQEELDSIKATNFDVFSFIETKRQLGNKWDKQDLEWLLSQDKNIFLKVLLSGAFTTSNCLDNNN